MKKIIMALILTTSSVAFSGIDSGGADYHVKWSCFFWDHDRSNRLTYDLISGDDLFQDFRRNKAGNSAIQYFKNKEGVALAHDDIFDSTEADSKAKVVITSFKYSNWKILISKNTSISLPEEYEFEPMHQAELSIKNGIFEASFEGACLNNTAAFEARTIIEYYLFKESNKHLVEKLSPGAEHKIFTDIELTEEQLKNKLPVAPEGTAWELKSSTEPMFPTTYIFKLVKVKN